MSKPKITYLQFLDYTYQNASLELQKEFGLMNDGKTKAVKWLMDRARAYCKWWSIFSLVTKYFLSRWGIINPPEPIPVHPKVELKVATAETIETPSQA